MLEFAGGRAEVLPLQSLALSHRVKHENQESLDRQVGSDELLLGLTVRTLGDFWMAGWKTSRVRRSADTAARRALEDYRLRISGLLKMMPDLYPPRGEIREVREDLRIALRTSEAGV